MIKKLDIEQLEEELQYRHFMAVDKTDKNIFVELLEYVRKATEVLFVGGVYKGIKWWQINRWTAIAKIAVSLLLHLIDLFKEKEE